MKEGVKKCQMTSTSPLDSLTFFSLFTSIVYGQAWEIFEFCWFYVRERLLKSTLSGDLSKKVTSPLLELPGVYNAGNMFKIYEENKESLVKDKKLFVCFCCSRRLFGRILHTSSVIPRKFLVIVWEPLRAWQENAAQGAHKCTRNIFPFIYWRSELDSMTNFFLFLMFLQVSTTAEDGSLTWISELLPWLTYPGRFAACLVKPVSLDVVAFGTNIHSRKHLFSFLT